MEEPNRENRKWIRISTAGTTVIRGDGNSARLHRIIINTAFDPATVVIYNSSGESSDPVSVLNVGFASNQSRVFDFNVLLDKGLTVVGSGGLDLTVIYE